MLIDKHTTVDQLVRHYVKLGYYLSRPELRKLTSVRVKVANDAARIAREDYDLPIFNAYKAGLLQSTTEKIEASKEAAFIGE